MLNPRWRKVGRDIWGNKTRTLLVVLSIAVGVFAVGLIAGTRAAMVEDLNGAFRVSNPAHAVLFAKRSDPEDDKTEGLFDEALIETVRRLEPVAQAEGRTQIDVRLMPAAAAKDTALVEASELELEAISDYDDIRIWNIWPQQGAWPPPKHAFLIERASLAFAGAQIGDEVTVKTPDGKLHQLLLAGVVYDPNRVSPTVEGGELAGYISLDTLEWLGELRYFNQLRLTVTGDNPSREQIETVVETVTDKIEDSGREVSSTWYPTTDKHPANEVLEPMFYLLGVLGFLALLLSGFLVINTISALLTQQLRQIGIMKTVGASRGQIVALYLITVFIFCLLSLAIAVPLGSWGAHLFATYLAGLVNIEITSPTLTPQVLALQAGVGLIVPLLAAVFPVFSGTRITVREALSSYGLGRGQFGASFVDRLLLGLRYIVLLPRPLLLSLRNTIRRKGRLIMTLLTLTLASAIFIAVFSVRSSMLRTLDDALQYWRYDVEMEFDKLERIEQIEREALRVPGVSAAEAWGFAGASRIRTDRPGEEAESSRYFMVAPPAETGMIRPTLLAGRWLLPQDENAVIINTDLLEEEPDLAVGDEIILEMDERRSPWQVVGLVRTTMSGPQLYANYAYFSRVTRELGRANWLHIVTEQHDLASATEAGKALESHFSGLGLKVSSIETIAGIRQQIETVFNIIIVFLLIMAVLLAVVGALGLMGMMSINVLERIREIGVMRAIGASDGAVQQIVLVEGILIGLLSWLLGVLIAIPVSMVLSNVVGELILEDTLTYTFSLGGALLWLGVVILLAALASYLPARSASRLTVREVLAYE